MPIEESGRVKPAVAWECGVIAVVRGPATADSELQESEAQDMRLEGGDRLGQSAYVRVHV